MVPGAKSFHRKAFLPAARRRDGPGVVYDEPLWQEYELDWRGVQFCIIQTTVRRFVYFRRRILE